MIAALVAAAILDAQPAPAAAATSAMPAAAPKKAVEVADEDKVVCKSQQVTGTRFSSRTCHTKRDWAQIEKDARDALADQQSQSYRNPSNGH